MAKFDSKLQESTAKSEGKTGRIFKQFETARFLIPEDKKKESIKELLTF